MVLEGLLSENLKNSFITLYETLKQCSSLKEIQNKILILENNFLASDSLSETEKENILHACSIAKYSSAHWVSKGVINPSSKNDNWAVLGCDIVGGIMGFMGGFSFGSWGAGVGMSALAVLCFESYN